MLPLIQLKEQQAEIAHLLRFAVEECGCGTQKRKTATTTMTGHRKSGGAPEADSGHCLSAEQLLEATSLLGAVLGDLPLLRSATVAHLHLMTHATQQQHRGDEGGEEGQDAKVVRDLQQQLHLTELAGSILEQQSTRTQAYDGASMVHQPVTFSFASDRFTSTNGTWTTTTGEGRAPGVTAATILTIERLSALER